MMLKLKLQYSGHLLRRVDSLEKTLMLGGIGGCREPVWGIPPMAKVMRKEARQKTKPGFVIWLQGFPLSFPEHLPPKTRVGLIFLYCGFPLFWHSLEKVNLGLQSSAFERNLSAQTPSDASLTCLTGSPGLFTTCELFTAPQPWEAQSLKHLKDTEPFLKS